MASFKVPCPSCDFGVLIKDTKLIGSKVECPKCKYRFKVEAPKDLAESESQSAGGKGKKKSKESAEKAQSQSAPVKTKGQGKPLDRKQWIGIGLGVVAVALLIIGGISMFGGSGSDNTVSRPPTTPRPTPPVVQNTKSPEVGSPTPHTNDNPMDSPSTPPPLPRSDKNPTNLLPAETQALVRVDLDRLRQTPVYHLIVNEAVAEVLNSALGLDARKVAHYYHAYVGEARLPFGIVRLKEPTPDKELLAALAENTSPPQTIQGHACYLVKPLAAHQALGKLLTLESLLGWRDPSESANQPAVRPLAACVYDTQTLLLADQQILEKFLQRLTPNGYPPFLTQYVSAASSSSGETSSVDNPNGNGSNGPQRNLSTNPDYCTVAPELKVLLNNLNNKAEESPIVLVAGQLPLGRRTIDLSSYPLEWRSWATGIFSNLELISKVGLAIHSFSTKEAAFELIIDSPTEASARTLRDQLGAGVIAAADALAPILGHQVAREGIGPPMPMTPGANSGAAGGESGSNPGEGEAPAPAPTTPNQPMNTTMPVGPSKIALSVGDRTLAIDAAFTFTPKLYSEILWPKLRSFGDQFQGQVLVLAGSAGQKLLAPGVAQLAATGEFPPGTSTQRFAGVNRYGMPFPPATRVSFLHSLLPHMGRGDVAGAIDPKLAWYDPQNIPAAERWIPEFLVPSYPPSSWWATSPYAEGRSLGATNVVGIAGIGRDAARLNPSNPIEAKRAGVMGYDWGSKLSDITDGPANTIYMLQVPPTYSRPWIAGGGATLMGVDDTLENPATSFTMPREGRRGTYAIMADGSVRWIAENIDKKVFLGLVTRAGGENLGNLEQIAPKEQTPQGELKTTDAQK